MSRGVYLGAGAFAALVAANNSGFWRYVLTTPGAWEFGTALTSLRSDIGAVLLAVIVILAAAACGLAAGFRPPAAAAEPERAGIEAFALGLGALGWGLMLLGLAGGYGRWSFCAVLAGAAGLFVWKRPSRQPVPRPALPRPHWALAALLSYCAWHVLCLALAPPTEWDVLAYHLALPKIYLLKGRVLELPWLIHSHWPHLMETLYGGLLALGSDASAAVLHAAACVALACAVFDWSRTHLPGPIAWLAPAILAAQPLFLRFAGTAHSDGAMALFYFLAATTIWEWTASRDPRRLIFAGIMAGLCAGTKLHGLVLAAGLAAGIMSTLRRRPAHALRSAALFLATALAVASPWYFKTWLGTGNPVWPFFSSLLGGDFGAARIEAPYLASSRWSWPPETDLIARYGGQHLLIPLAGAALLARARLPQALRFLLFPLALYAPFVIRQHEAWRFMWPFLPVLALCLAWWTGRLLAGRGAPRYAALALLAIALAPAFRATQNNQLFAVLGAGSPSQPGRSPRELYQAKALPGYAALKAASRALGPGDRVLLFREIRGYLVEADYVWGDPLNQGLISYSQLSNPQELGGRLRDLGITHVLVNSGLPLYAPSPNYYSPWVVSVMGAVLADSRPVLSQEGVVLHALR